METEGQTTVETWKRIMNMILKHGKDYIDSDGRDCREVLNFLMSIKNTEDITFPVETMRNFEKWVYPEIEEIRDFILKREKGPSYLYVYGQRIFNYNESIDQIEDYIIPLLKKNPLSRRAVVSLWNPLFDSNTANQENPSIMNISFKMKDKKLELLFTIRSCELFFGWPTNVLQMHTIQRHIAEKLGCRTGSLTTFAFSAHLFLEHSEDIKRILKHPS